MTRAAPARSAARWQVKGPRCEDASWRLALVRVGFFLWRGCELGFWQGVVVPTRACAGGPPSDFDRAYLKMLISFYFYGGAQISCRARGPPNCREGDRHTPPPHSASPSSLNARAPLSSLPSSPVAAPPTSVPGLPALGRSARASTRSPLPSSSSARPVLWRHAGLSSGVLTPRPGR